jgi:hypothetical protein
LFRKILIKLHMHCRRARTGGGNVVNVMTKVNLVRRSSQLALALLIVLAGASPIFAAARADRVDCQGRAIGELQRLSGRGYAVYQALADKKQFLTWVSCDDIQTELSTGVHESVHILTQEKDAYPLMDGSLVPRPHEVSRFFAPRDIAKSLDAHDVYVQNYLGPNGASSKTDFMYLLDELNAYTHDLDTAVALVSLQRRDRDVDHRDGLAAVMSFVMRYVDTARRTQPASWQGLQRAEPRRAVQALWGQAETTLASSCGLPAFGLHDRDYVAYLCEKNNTGALAELLDRAPVCPTECLAPATTSSTAANPSR